MSERDRSWAEAERVVVRRTRSRIAVLTGLIISLLVTFVGGIAYVEMVRAQDGQVWRELRYSAEHGEPSAPPGCTWLFTLDQQHVPGAPAGFPLRADLDHVTASRSAVERTVERDGTRYLVRTQPRAGSGPVQAVFDMRFQLADRRHLLEALAVAELVGLLAAAVAGFVVGRRAVAPLAEVLARQRRFVTDASHELRTPITRAYTRVQVLMRRAAAADLPADHRAGLDRLAGAVGWLGEVIDDLLRSARLRTGRDGVGSPPVDLAAIAESVVAAEAVRVRERRLTVTVDRPSDPLFVDGVESALRRAVGELLANAVTHTPPGGRIGLIIGRATTDGVVELTVSDDGAGFEPDQADRIFDRFHRGQDAAGSSGLGLALLREVVTSHRGTVEAGGHPGRGARFVMRLPESRASR